jgi:hypothetical protein
MPANTTGLSIELDATALADVRGGEFVIGEGARARVVIPCQDLRAPPPGSAASRLTEEGRDRLKGICDLYPGALSVWPRVRDVPPR